MLCIQCGAENPPEARFCGSCGAAMVERPPAPAAVPQPVAAPSAPPAASGPAAGPAATVVDLAGAPPPVSAGLKYGVLFATLLFPLVGLIAGGLFWLRGPGPERVATGKMWFFTALGLMLLYAVLSVSDH
jgi:hypothetical protein